ncbi:hypothetical protein KEM60_00644 [Austwickia sp. TVS 96-490-7B]|uniref:hypothetical protein n=1 Tax=Austwickia sp. TVS 96-490-7B TaxID=2830843 RepID=UPI001C5914AD|nr:hypothetical protein [Austwickia sp. TVS 96-490-7B]MBW3084456.1 hypothetical protein [Austwickia sp. TVS 96-490-7B]
MTSPDRGTLRLARLAAFVVACLVLATAGHSHASPHAPGLGATLIVVVPLILTGLWFTARERGTTALFVLLSVVQLSLHGIFALAHQGSHLSAVPSLSASCGLSPVVMTRATLPRGSWDLTVLIPEPTMMWSHLVATLLTAAFLGWGERSLWAWFRRVRPALPGALREIVVPVGPPPVGRPKPRLRSVALQHVAPVRGPPCLALLA